MTNRSSLPTPVQDERGTALIWALLFVVITSGMVISHAMFMAAGRRERDSRYGQVELSKNLGQSAMADALAWFRKQPVQPVASFDPRLDPAADPPILDTIDPTLGLVREFEIRGNLWGRYEVRREEVEDVSAERGQTSPGVAWSLGLRSYVYRIVDPSRPFNSAPNRIVAASNATTEVRTIPLMLPAPGAINALDPDEVDIGDNAIVHGGGSPALAYGDATGSVAIDPTADGQPNVSVIADVQGTPDTVAVVGLDVDRENVFSMRIDELQAYADVVLRSSGVTELQDVGEGVLIVVRGSLVLDSAIKLQDVVLIVEQDLTVPAGSTGKVYIDGVVHVGGDATINGEFELHGSLIVEGVLAIGRGTQPVQMIFEPTLVDIVRAGLAEYRAKRTLLPPR